MKDELYSSTCIVTFEIWYLFRNIFIASCNTFSDAPENRKVQNIRILYLIKMEYKCIYASYRSSLEGHPSFTHSCELIV